MNEGCGRKIKTSENLSLVIKKTLESVVHGTRGDPSPGEVIVDLTIPRVVRENAEYLLATGKFDLEYPCCTIVHDDCRKHLINFPPQSFDIIVTDPPYGMDFKKAFQAHHGKQDWDKRFPTEIVHSISDEISILGGLARLGSYVFCRWDNLWDHQFRVDDVAPGASVGVTLSKPTSVLVWHKIGGGAMGDTEHEHIRNYEMALFYPGPEHRFKTRAKSVLTYEPCGNDDHPTEKPVEMLQEILSWYDDCETVFDPFMGSGATAVAAKELGKHYFGFEAKEGFHKKAIQRLAEISE